MPIFPHILKNSSPGYLALKPTQRRLKLLVFTKYDLCHTNASIG